MRIHGDLIRLSATDLVGHLACRHLSALDLAVAMGKRAEPKGFDPFLDARLTANEKRAVLDVIARRVDERMPAAYLTGEAWLGDYRFAVGYSNLAADAEAVASKLEACVAGDGEPLGADREPVFQHGISRVRVDAAVRGQRSTISFTAMADGSDVNKALVVCDSVNNAPLAYANAP